MVTNLYLLVLNTMYHQETDQQIVENILAQFFDLHKQLKKSIRSAALFLDVQLFL